MKIAAVDLGTNAFRVLIQEKDQKSYFNILKYREIVGLGKHLNSDNELRLTKKYYSTLNKIFLLLKKYNVEKVKIVGTSVFRDATNKKQIKSEFFSKWKYKLNIISPKVEAELTAKGAISKFKKNDKYLVVDIGGGSTELVLVIDDNVSSYISLNIGVVKMLKKFKNYNEYPINELTKISEYVYNFLISNKINKQFLNNDFHIIMNAGTPTTLAAIDLKMEQYDEKKISGHKMSLVKTYKILNLLSKISWRERLNIVGLEKGREKVIVFGIIILIKIVEFFNKKNYLVSDSGVLEGIFEKYFEI